MRLTAESGGNYGAVMNGVVVPMEWGMLVTIITVWLFPNLSTTNVMTMLWRDQIGFSGIMATLPLMGMSVLYCLKAGKTVKASLKDLMKIIPIAVVIGAALGMIISTMWFEFYPLASTAFAASKVGETYYWGSAIPVTILSGDTNILTAFPMLGIPNPEVFHVYINNFADMEYTTWFIVKIVIGAAIAIAIPLMRKRWGWMRISVAGLGLGILWGPRIWCTSLVALVIRYVGTKVGGVELYQKKIVPLMLGLIAGYLITFFVFGMVTQTWASMVFENARL
jgi:hypothetical protein